MPFYNITKAAHAKRLSIRYYKAEVKLVIRFKQRSSCHYFLERWPKHVTQTDVDVNEHVHGKHHSGLSRTN